MIYERTNRRSLRYSLELRMATLFTFYWKARLKKWNGYSSDTIKDNIKKIVRILKDNNVIIKPNGNKEIKILIYNILLLISGGHNGKKEN